MQMARHRAFLIRNCPVSNHYSDPFTVTRQSNGKLYKMIQPIPSEFQSPCAAFLTIIVGVSGVVLGCHGKHMLVMHTGKYIAFAS